MADVLLLKWNNHENSFLSLLSSLRKYNFHTDATLACDGQLYQVHKVVLSACSDYFSHIFQSISCPNPVIVLKDMSPTNVESLLDYMYLGEARIKQIDLAALIQAADCLKLKGLAVNLVNNPYTTKNDENISQNSKTPVTTKTVDDSHSEDNMNSEENLKTEQYEDDTIQKNDEIVEAVPFDIDAEMKFDNSGQEILSATIKPEENCNPLLTDPLAGTETETSSLEIHNSIETASSSHNCSTDYLEKSDVQDKMDKAMEEIRSGMSIRKAAIKYGIAKSTLGDRVSGKRVTISRKSSRTYLTPSEELLLVNFIENAQKRAIPITKERLSSLMCSFLDQEIDASIERPTYKIGMSGTNEPSRIWFNGFRKRHPQIVNLTNEGLSESQKAVSRANLRQWFLTTENYFCETENDILNDPTRQFNVDELGFWLSPKTKTVLGIKAPRTVSNEMNITVLANIGADGSLPPPLIIYPYERMENLTEEQSRLNPYVIGRSTNGHMNYETFYKYLCNDFDQWLTDEGIKRPVVIWVDMQDTLINYHLANKLIEQKIILHGLPPNTTHIMHPLDISVFEPLKVNYRKHCNSFREMNTEKVITINNFADIFLPCYTETMADRQNAINGFRKCGLYPFNFDAVDYTELPLEHERRPSSSSVEKIDKEGIKDNGKQAEHFFPIDKGTQVDTINLKEIVTNACNTEFLDADRHVAMDDLVLVSNDRWSGKTCLLEQSRLKSFQNSAASSENISNEEVTRISQEPTSVASCSRGTPTVKRGISNMINPVYMCNPFYSSLQKTNKIKTDEKIPPVLISQKTLALLREKRKIVKEKRRTKKQPRASKRQKFYSDKETVSRATSPADSPSSELDC